MKHFLAKQHTFLLLLLFVGLVAGNYQVIDFSSGYNKCCNAQTYNTATSVCCSNTLYDYTSNL